MLRIVQSKSAAHAKSYYVENLSREGLSREGYYSEAQETPGKWQGKAAERLGLSGTVAQEEFHALCDNLHPATGDRLTARTNSDRTVGYDFNFHVPKSVSAMYAHCKDERIVSAMHEAVGDTMREMEADMQTRVRVGGAQQKRVTGNMVWAEFVHMTARPVDGKPDPHLHVHAYAFNATYDPVEERWKAGHFGDLKRDAPYYEAAFHSRLAGSMRELGYGVEAKGKFWEIEGVPQSVIDKFSRRRDQIEALAEERGVIDAAEKDKLGALSREKKVKLGMEELRSEWASRLTPEEKAAMDAARQSGHGREGRGSGDIAERAMDHSLSHVFERASVVSEKDVLEAALRFGVGQLSVDQAQTAFAADTRIFHKMVNGEKRCTTAEVRDEEKAMVSFARETRNSLDAIKISPHQFSDHRLNADQRKAVQHILSSRDQVTMIRGRPGTGKTTLMKETVGAINAQGYGVVALAPTAEASRTTLREAGFTTADTVESFLQSAAKQKQARGQVIWVDEAGLLSARAMKQLFDVAKAQDCRVILAGDTGQHNAVERGDAMRTLEKHAGLAVSEVKKIIRQKENKDYCRVVEAMSGGDIKKAFATLEKMKAFVENPDIAKLHDRIAADYIAFLKSGKEALIIAPQHQEGAAITARVRGLLREAGKIKGEDHAVERLSSLKLTVAERSDPRHYQARQVVQFVQHAPGFRRGERLNVVGRAGENVTVQNAVGETRALPLKLSSRFELYNRGKIALAAGDKIRITNNGFAKSGQRLDNGTVHTVAGVRPNGEIELKNKSVLAPGFGHITHGYYVTSHVSQSKTVDWTLLAQSSLSFAAGSREQVNVSLSRGREGIRIYTDDKAELRERASRSSARESALDFLGHDKTGRKRAEQRKVIATDMNRWQKAWQKRRDQARLRPIESELRKEARGVTEGRKRGFEIDISL